MALDRRYLKKHGNQWRVVIKVPERLREIIGKAHLVHPLHTDSLAVANREKFKHLAAMKATLQEAEREARRRAKLPADPLVEEALTWRAEMETTKAAAAVVHEFDDGAEETTFDVVASLLGDRIEEIARRDGRGSADTFIEIATGRGTPILAMIEAWIVERNMKPRQQIDYRRAVTKFEAWLTEKRLPPTVEACDRKTAGRYVAEAFIAKRANVKTANKDVSALSSYWRWLERKGYVSANVWREQALQKPKTAKVADKRPYTAEEMQRLFSGTPSPLLLDFMRIAALSGMRIEEIAKLKAGNVIEVHGVKVFDIVEAKTKAGVRQVPVHPDLAEIIERRLDGKAAGDPLFPELPIPPPGSAVERSQKVVKAFTAYRRKVGVDDTPEGARQSRVDFHSFRRWFITKAEQAENPPHFIEAVVGHKRQGMSLGGYSGGPLMDQFRRVVESVRLPSE